MSEKTTKKKKKPNQKSHRLTHSAPRKAVHLRADVAVAPTRSRFRGRDRTQLRIPRSVFPAKVNRSRRLENGPLMRVPRPALRLHFERLRVNNMCLVWTSRLSHLARQGRTVKDAAGAVFVLPSRQARLGSGDLEKIWQLFVFV